MVTPDRPTLLPRTSLADEPWAGLTRWVMSQPRAALHDPVAAIRETLNQIPGLRTVDAFRHYDELLGAEYVWALAHAEGEGHWGAAKVSLTRPTGPDATPATWDVMGVGDRRTALWCGAAFLALPDWSGQTTQFLHTCFERLKDARQYRDPDKEPWDRIASTVLDALSDGERDTVRFLSAFTDHSVDAYLTRTSA